MKQLLQSLKSGEVEVAAVPLPSVKEGQVLIASSRTLVSAGTERMLVDFGKSSLIGKARRQPDKVRLAVQKIRTDGLAPTLEAVLNRLDQPLPMGYCNVGVVKEAGRGVNAIAVGDRVASNGKHAEAVVVPTNLCAKVPDGVSDDEAAFTVIGAIGLQGIRLLQPTLGESVVVTGLGLIGLITVQLLRANGCRVLGLDFDPERLALARRFGAEVVNLSEQEDPVSAANAFSRGRAVDGVVITAATKSNEPVDQAALMCRKRGRIVLVGVAGLELSRSSFYEKELSFQVSCSYGPGRYDPVYEEKGFDYPIGFVRWTEQRNFEAVLDMMADGRLKVTPLISHRFSVDDAVDAYEIVTGSEPSLGILLEYPGIDTDAVARTVPLRPDSQSVGKTATTDVSIGFIGAGSYATAMLVPAFSKAGAELRSIASQTGVSSAHAGRKFGFAEATTDVDRLLAHPDLDALVISTRHDSHAELTCGALAAGKDVYVEKPLAVTNEQLDAVEAAHAVACASGTAPVLMVGFNRRFSPLVETVKRLLSGIKEPKAFVMTVNAGDVPPDHWTQDPSIGGGRIVGEACHFIDLLRYLAAAPFVQHTMVRLESRTGDTASMSFRFSDGSVGTVHYFANGNRRLPKERLEIFAGGRALQLDNFRKLKCYDWPGGKTVKQWRQDKGQAACARSFIEAVGHTRKPPIPTEELFEVARVTIALAEATRG